MEKSVKVLRNRLDKCPFRPSGDHQHIFEISKSHIVELHAFLSNSKNKHDEWNEEINVKR